MRAKYFFRFFSLFEGRVRQFWYWLDAWVFRWRIDMNFHSCLTGEFWLLLSDDWNWFSMLETLRMPSLSTDFVNHSLSFLKSSRHALPCSRFLYTLKLSGCLRSFKLQLWITNKTHCVGENSDGIWQMSSFSALLASVSWFWEPLKRLTASSSRR